MITPDARPRLIEVIRSALEAFDAPYSAQIITDACAGSTAWEMWWFGTDTREGALRLFGGLSNALAGGKLNGTMPPSMQWLGCVVSEQMGGEGK